MRSCSTPCASLESTWPAASRVCSLGELAAQADVVVTMGCGDECPYIPGKRYIDWELADPAGRSLEEVRLIRDDIARRVEKLLAELDGS